MTAAAVDKTAEHQRLVAENTELRTRVTQLEAANAALIEENEWERPSKVSEHTHA